MAYYNTCPNCGCNLDPGEKCSCKENMEKNQKEREDFFNKHLKIEPLAGQISFVLDKEAGYAGKII